MLVEVLVRLRKERTELAEEFLANPANRDSFEYGKACGAYHGLGRAIDMVEELLRDEDEREKGPESEGEWV